MFKMSPLSLHACGLLVGGLILQVCLTSTNAVAAPATTPLVDLPDGPMIRTPSHPNTILDLSVEFPTAGAAYRADYDSRRRYLGYFDYSQCYKYTSATTYKKKGGSGPKVHDNSAPDDKYFYVDYAADANRNCTGNAFSGNFMNWAASSAIDMLRVGLTGGDRVVDTVSKTILQRAVLPPFFYADNYRFPVKHLPPLPALPSAPPIIDPPPTVNPSQVTPFSSSALHIISCKNRVIFTNVKPTDRTGTTAKPLDVDYAACDKDKGGNNDKKLGEYVVRVEVCTDTEGPRRTDLCQRYGSNYKPEGQIQKNADKMRFAAFGYLMDNDTNRQGGVLRAAAKYVGPLKYDSALVPSVNDAKEWSASTGRLIDDPDGSGSTEISGVINYLNRFGRNGTYKVWDPVSELYYESMRYLQGLSPSSGAISNLDAGKRGGFPVFTTWTDPVVESCQKNSIILIADANTNYDYSVPGNNRSVSDPNIPAVVDTPVGSTPSAGGTAALDVVDWVRKIGIHETATHGIDTKTRPTLDGLKTNTKTNGYWAPADELLKGSYYVSGLSYWANTTDLRPGKLKNRIHAKTFVIDVDEGGNGDLDDGNTRPFTKPRDSQLYLAAKYGGYEPDPDDPENPYYKATALTALPTSGCVPYLWDVNGNCDPDNYFLASDGSAFVSAITKAFVQAAPEGEAITAVGASNERVTVGTNTFIYQGKFLKGAAGDLRRMQVNYSVTDGLTIAPPDSNTPTKFLKEVASTATPPSGGRRKIYTYNGASTSTASTIPFEWSQLNPSQKAMLNSTDNLGLERLWFLRGSTEDELSASNKKGFFRERPKSAYGNTNILGDIVHSNPVVVAAPKKFVQGDGYQAFVTAHGTRPAAVYVGANDGMLHAFNTNMQTEYFAYVPKMIFPKLKLLTDRNYKHTSYVDGGIVAAEAKVGTQWKTVLASTMGEGAQGVFALDVSDPTAFDPDHGAIWEFSDADDADMGTVFSPPVIAKFFRGVVSGVPKYEYFVVLSSGVNNYKDDGNVSTNAKGGALFLLSLNKPSNQAWSLNSNYFKIPIPDSAFNSSKQAGLSAPEAVLGGDGAVRAVYAGDLQGNLWRFSFQALTTLSNATAHRIFRAVDSSGNHQPITVQPEVVFAPEGGYVVLFGTGKYMETPDIKSHAQQSFYGIYDSFSSSYVVSGRSQLESRTVAGAADDTNLTITGNGFSYFGSGSTTKKGWYLDYANTGSSGERSVTPGVLAYGHVFFNTLLPPDDACHITSSGRSYALNSLTGLPDGGSGEVSGNLSQLGALSSPVSFNTLPATSPASATPDALGKATRQRKYTVAKVGTKGSGLYRDRVADIPSGRMSWREILNYKELRNAAIH